MKRSPTLHWMVFAIMMIPMLAIGAFWKASQPVVTTSNVQASTTEITLDYTLTDTDPASIMTTSGYSPEAVLVDSSGLVLASETLQIDTPSSLSLSGFSLTYGEEYTVRFDVPYDLLGIGSPYNEEPYTIYEESITIDKQAPTAVIYGVDDIPASIVTGNEIEVHYDLVDDDEALIMNETIAPRMIIWNNATDEVVDLASVEIGQDQVVTFSGLEDSIIYRVEITGQYDVDGDGLTDNSSPYILAEQLFTGNYSPQWDQVYGGSKNDTFISVIETSDGGYLAVGETYSNANGELTDTNNGSRDGLLVKFDSFGNPEWDQVYGGNSSDTFYVVAETSDGGYIVAGYTSSGASGEITDNNNGSYDGLLVKFDSAGNPVWDQVYGGGSAEEFYSVIEDSDGNYVAAGVTFNDGGEITDISNGGWDGLLVKFDSEGNPIWDQLYGGAGDDQFNYMIETSDNTGYIVAGFTIYSADYGELTDTNNGNADGLLAKFDKEGNPVWDQAYGGTGSDRFDGLIENSNGGYVAVGRSLASNGEITDENNGNFDGLVAAFDSQGNPVWDQVYGGSEAERFTSIIETRNGEYAVVGRTESNDGEFIDTSNGGQDGILLKLDSEGAPLWDELYGGPGTDSLYSVIEASDGSYVIAGYTDGGGELTDSNNGGSDALLVKFPAK